MFRPSPRVPRELSISRARGAKSTEALGEDQKYEVSERKSLWSSIKAGRSFVDDESEVSPWLFASDSHGTRMANLICAMDPFCELYVARVAEGKYGITPDREARASVLLPPSYCLFGTYNFLNSYYSSQATQWALEKEADIIFMSIAVLDPSKDNMEWWVTKARESSPTQKVK